MVWLAVGGAQAGPSTQDPEGGVSVQPPAATIPNHRSDAGKEPAAPSANLSDLPLPAQLAISETFGHEDEAYHAQRTGPGYHAANPAQGLAADWTTESVAVQVGDARWQVRLAGWGYGDARPPTPPVPPQASANRVEYRRGALTEWYVNGPLGLEQGFTLAAAPGPNPAGAPLTLALAQSGDPSTGSGRALRAAPAGAGLALTTADGTATPVRYDGLAARDAAGRALPAWLEVQGDYVLLRVDDAGARYPIVVDPLVQQGKLTAFGDADDRFGWAVALSGDGLTALVGAFRDDVGANADQGAAYVFKLSNGVWGLQARLTANDGAAYDWFGYAVALNQDGSTALVGASLADPGGRTSQGAAYVFVRSGGLWSQQQKLTAADGAAGDWFGSAVALSHDGHTALVGAYYDAVGPNPEQGSAYAFTRSGTTWSQQQRIVAPGGAANNYLGFAVALGGNEQGDMALIGAPGDDNGGYVDRGAVYVFGRSGGSWGWLAQLTATDGTAYDQFGYAVSLSDDGSDALIGAPFDDVGGQADQGSAYVFSRSGGPWSQQQQLTAADGAAYDYFGWTVALDGDENTALVGAYSADVDGQADQGAAYLYTRSGGSWPAPLKITVTGGAAGDGFGFAVALDGAGDTALVGAWKDDVGSSADQGTALVLGRSGGVWGRRAQLTASNGAANDLFGSAVALSGDGSTALVGADSTDIGSNAWQGAAYVFVRSGSGVWLPQQKLTASDGAVADFFGSAVALSDNGHTALVGAVNVDIGSNPNQGAAYVFVRSGTAWSQQQKLFTADGKAGDLFGLAVALSDDGHTALVGAASVDIGSNPNQGAAYVFVRSGTAWSQQQKLFTADGKAGDLFGRAVALSGDGATALVGAPWADVGGNTNQGAAYVFARSGAAWSEQGKLVATDGSADDYFGWGVVALSNDGSTALVGASGSNGYQGAAYVFVRSGETWSEQEKLVATDGAADDYFGTSVALSGDGHTALVGAPGDLGGNSNQGAAYVFVRSGGTWSQQATVADLVDGAAGDYFGWAVALDGSGSTALVGAPQVDVGSNWAQGAAYVYLLPETPILLGPPDGTVTNDITPTFTWQPAANAAGYRLNLNGGIYDVGDVEEFTIDTLPDGPYTWTVAAYDVFGNTSPYAAPWHLTVDVTANPAWRIYLPLVVRH